MVKHHHNTELNAFNFSDYVCMRLSATANPLIPLRMNELLSLTCIRLDMAKHRVHSTLGREELHSSMFLYHHHYSLTTNHSIHPST